MTTLLDLHQQIAREVMLAMKPSDIVIGTVTHVNPLAVSIKDDMPDLPAASLLLTEAVIEKRINLKHTHTLNGHTHGNQVPPDVTNTDIGTLEGNAFTNAPYFPDYGEDG